MKINIKFVVIFLLIINIISIFSLRGAFKIQVFQTVFYMDTSTKNLISLDIDNFSCGYCGDILKDANIDLINNVNCCQECIDKMLFYLINPNSTNITDIFPMAQESGINMENIVAKLNEHCDTSEAWYKVDSQKQQEMIAVADSVLCQDCDYVLPFKDIVQHAREHRFICQLCGLSMEGDFEERVSALTQHENTCTKPCLHCSDNFGVQHLENHQITCLKKQFICQCCKESVDIETYGVHCIMNLCNEMNDHAVIICPICEKKLPGMNFQEHFNTLHLYNIDNNIGCFKCENHFFTGTELLQHVTSEHPSDLEQLLSRDPNDSSIAEQKLLKIVKWYTISRNNTSMDHDVAKLEKNFSELKLMTTAKQQDLEQKIKFCNSSIATKTKKLVNEIAVLQVSLNQLTQQLQILCCRTTDGKFLWKIPDVAKRVRDAKDKKITSLYSPPFYTSTNGYKLGIRTYLNGDGSGEKEFLSIFLVIYMGENDVLLKWPFSHNYGFSLINQNDQNKSLWQIAKPNKESSSFQKPKNEMNIATGFPKFCPIAVLDDTDYVKDDVMFIKFFIDKTSLIDP